MVTHNAWRAVPLVTPVIINASQPPFLGTVAIVDGSGQVVAITTEGRAPLLLAALTTFLPHDAPPVAQPVPHTTSTHRKQMAAEATALRGLLFGAPRVDIQNELGD